VERGVGQADQQPFTLYQIRETATGEAIGGAGFFGPPDTDGVVTLGYGLVPSARGKGYATEAVVGMLKIAQTGGALIVAADTSIDNDASVNVLRKTGFVEVDRTDDNIFFRVVLAADPDDTRIRLVTEDKKRFMNLLLLADEQEDMIDGYLDRGDLFVMGDDTLAVAVCVVTNEGNGVFEVRNLAVRPDRQRHGYGQKLLRHVESHYVGRIHDLIVGTGDSPITVPFYEACGFAFDHRVPRGIADTYDHPIIEAGVRLIDKVYLRKTVDSAEIWDVLDVNGLTTGRTVKRDLDGEVAVEWHYAFNWLVGANGDAGWDDISPDT